MRNNSLVRILMVSCLLMIVCQVPAAVNIYAAEDNNTASAADASGKSNDESKPDKMKTFYIDINSPNYDKLTANLPKDLTKISDARQLLLLEPYQDYVDARISYEGKDYKVETKLRGDNYWHWIYEKKSLKIKTKKSNLIDGIRKFNFSAPREKTMLVYSLEASLASRMGILTPNVEPVKVYMNDEYAGVFLSIEEIDEIFLRRNGKLPSNIYDDEKSWNNIKIRSAIESNGIYSWKSAENWEKLAENNTMKPEDFSDLEYLLKIVNNTPKEKFPVEIEEVLDIDKYLKWYAHSEISGSLHQDSYHNNKLYVDPSSGKFEPIAWDAHGFSTHNPPDVPLDTPMNPLNMKILQNPEYIQKANQYLWEAVNGEGSYQKQAQIIDDMYNKIKKAVYDDANKRWIEFLGGDTSAETYSNQEYDRSVEDLKKWIKQRNEYIKKQLETCILYTSGVIYNSAKNSGVIGFTADGYSGSTLKGIELNTTYKSGNIQLWRDKNFNGICDENDELVKEQSAGSIISIEMDEPLLPGRKVIPLLLSKRLKYMLNMNFNLEPQALNYNYILKYNGPEKSGNITLKQIKAVNATTKNEIKTSFKQPASNNSDLFSIHPWKIIRAKSGQSVTFYGKEYVIDKDIVIDENSSITIESGAVLKLQPGKSILVYGRADIRGTKDKPVQFTAADKNKPWGVLAIQGSNSKDSIIENAVFEYGGQQTTLGHVTYTGMVSAYNTELSMKNCILRYSRGGDDAFNAKNSNIHIDGCKFSNVFSDAVDFDYSEGTIENCYFYKSGNDAIDLMTSNPLIKGNLMEGNGDKGVSVGEEANPVIFNNVITGNSIGIESKDKSEPLIINNLVCKNKIGVNLYLKNYMYGGGGKALVVNSIVADNLELDYKTRDKSSISFVNSNLGRGDGKNIDEKDTLREPVKFEEFKQNKYMTPAKFKSLIGGGTNKHLEEAVKDVKETVIPMGLLYQLNIN